MTTTNNYGKTNASHLQHSCTRATSAPVPSTGMGPIIFLE